MKSSLADVDQDLVRLTPNIAYVSWQFYNNVKNRAGLTRFRQTWDKKGVIVIDVPTHQLTTEDICTINEFCDGYDPKKNAEVKRIIGGAVDDYIGKKDFQIVEFGGGYNLLPTNAPSHHSIEIDPKIIKAQMERGISASTYEDMAEGTLRTDCPRIAPAIYSFHFMNPQHVEQISTVVSHDGFFMANCMKAHHNGARQSMIDAFTKAGMKVGIVNINTEATAEKVKRTETSLQKAFGDSLAVARKNIREMRDAAPLTNEFWVVAYDDKVLEKALGHLARNVARARPNLEVWESRVLDVA